MSIIFRKDTGEKVFTLSDFTKKKPDFSIIGYQFCFDLDGFKSQLMFEAELYDFEDLLKGLNYLSDNLKGEFYFQPMIDSRIKVKFEMDDTGHLKIDGSVSNLLYSISLSFKFISDQSHLEELIKQTKIVLASSPA